MVVLGFDEPMWVTALRQRGPEIAVAVMQEVPGVRRLVVEPDVDGRRVVAAGEANHNDKYTTAWNITEALTELWSAIADDSVGLVVTVGSLQIEVPGAYFREQLFTRNRWAATSTSMLVHTTVHDAGSPGLFSDKGAHHT